jgi:hypothetical protein
MTALHIFAYQNAREDVVRLIECQRCDYLIHDRWFRLPHELAVNHADKSDICDLLFAREEEQILLQGFTDFESYVFSERGPWRIKAENPETGPSF